MSLKKENSFYQWHRTRLISLEFMDLHPNKMTLAMIESLSNHIWTWDEFLTFPPRSPRPNNRFGGGSSLFHYVT